MFLPSVSHARPSDRRVPSQWHKLLLRGTRPRVFPRNVRLLIFPWNIRLLVFPRNVRLKTNDSALRSGRERKQGRAAGCGANRPGQFRAGWTAGRESRTLSLSLSLSLARSKSTSLVWSRSAWHLAAQQQQQRSWARDTWWPHSGTGETSPSGAYGTVTDIRLW